MDSTEPIRVQAKLGLPSRAEQNYLKAIHRLGGAEERVSPVRVADLIRVRAPSVTGMFKRLRQAGWIHYDRRAGAQLSEEGIVQARQAIRRHRLVEVFLARVLGLNWSEVDAEANNLTYTISDRLDRAIADFLGNPVEDPHGHPIPTLDGKLEERRLKPLCTFSSGQRIILREVDENESDRLQHWQELGLLPGTRVDILSYQSLDDVFYLRIENKVIPIGRKGIEGLYGEEEIDVAAKAG